MPGPKSGFSASLVFPVAQLALKWMEKQGTTPPALSIHCMYPFLQVLTENVPMDLWDI